jgi:hypothetical protein
MEAEETAVAKVEVAREVATAEGAMEVEMVEVVTVVVTAVAEMEACRWLSARLDHTWRASSCPPCAFAPAARGITLPWSRRARS